MADRIKVLSFSDSINVPTGYSRVCKEIFSRLDTRKFEHVHWGKQSVAEPHWSSMTQDFYLKTPEQIWEENQANFTSPEGFKTFMHKNFARQIPMDRESDGRDISDFHLRREKPDIYFELLDMWMANWVLEKDFTPAKFISYIPLDGFPIPDGCHRHILKADIPVAMSMYGKRMIEEATFPNDIGGPDIRLADRLTRPVEYIPHGVDTKVYRPLSREEIEAEKVRSGIAGRFVVGMVARNQPRKSHERLFKAFAKFQKGKPNVALWLHCDPKDQQGFDLVSMARKWGISPFYSKIPNFKWGTTDALLNQIYNLFDVHLLSTTGEGFGLPIIEAMAAGVPNILVDYTTAREFMTDQPTSPDWPDAYSEFRRDIEITSRGILAPVDTTVCGVYNVERAIPSVNGLVDAMEFAYHNPNDLKQMGRNARKAAQEQYDWDILVKRWEKLFIESTRGRTDET